MLDVLQPGVLCGILNLIVLSKCLIFLLCFNNADIVAYYFVG